METLRFSLRPFSFQSLACDTWLDIGIFTPKDSPQDLSFFLQLSSVEYYIWAGLARPWPWASQALGRPGPGPGRSRPGPVGLAIVFMRSDYLHTCSIRLQVLAWDLLLESMGSFAFGLD